ncbi:hypothetical protein ACFPRL_09580 [Pseudoclavibacter helvolus]
MPSRQAAAPGSACACSPSSLLGAAQVAADPQTHGGRATSRAHEGWIPRIWNPGQAAVCAVHVRAGTDAPARLFAYGRAMTTPQNVSPASGDSNDSSTGDENLRDIIEEVEGEHGRDGAAAMADKLRDRTEETQQEEEDPAEEQN